MFNLTNCHDVTRLVKEHDLGTRSRLFFSTFLFVSIVSVVSLVSMALFSLFPFARFGGFVSLFRVLVHREVSLLKYSLSKLA